MTFAYLNAMYYLIYTSTARSETDEVELYDILTTSVKKNEKFNITGLLIYHEGSFIQMLEGDQENVDDIYDSIKVDNRHHNVIKLISGQSEKRYFPDWSMALKVTHKKTFLEIKSYKSIIDSSKFLQGIQNDHIGLQLLRFFYEVHMAENNQI